MSNNSIFDQIVSLPSDSIAEQAKSLIGFHERYKNISGNLKMMLDPDSLMTWSQLHHDGVIPIINHLHQRYPLVIMAGDVGTGKTISAITIADELTRELKKEGFFIQLSTRVRGQGLHGEMGNLINDAFDRLKQETGKKRLGFLFIDEADAIATSRSTNQMHQEEKAAVNTLIQKIDEIREMGGRAIVIMSTNRLHFIDEAIVRRAAVIMQFERPNFEQRLKLLEENLRGAKFTSHDFKEVAKMTGEDANNGLGYSFSDLRLRVLPYAISICYPDNPLTFEAVKLAIKNNPPSPRII